MNRHAKRGRIMGAGLAVAGATSFFCFADGLTPPDEAWDGDKPVAHMKSLDQVEPRQIIAQLPFTIDEPGSYYLTRSMLMTNENHNGIFIAANDVQIDLGGFSINGASNTWSGIYVVATNRIWENITIRNGIVRGWGQFGINATNARDVVVSHVKSSHNRWGGIYLGENAMVEQCTAYGNGFGATPPQHPPLDGGIYARSFSSVLNSMARGNDGAGIWVGHHSKVLGCHSTGSQQAEGIRVEWYGTVRDNVVSGNKNGIYAQHMSRVIGNTVGQNQETGIIADGNNNIIERNLMVGNKLGIKTIADAPQNLVVNNFASMNTTRNYELAEGTPHGPIITVTNEIGSSNPWANIEFGQ